MSTIEWVESQIISNDAYIDKYKKLLEDDKIKLVELEVKIDSYVKENDNYKADLRRLNESKSNI